MNRDKVLTDLVEKQTSYFNSQMVSDDTRAAVFKEIQKRQEELALLNKS